MVIGLLVNHWRGQLPVLTSVLGVIILGSMVIIAVSRLFLLTVPDDISLELVAKLELGWLAGCLVALGWAVIETWRSAGRATRSVMWVTRVAISIAVILGAPRAARSAEYALDLVQLASERDPMGPPAQVSVKGRQVRVVGTLSQGTAERFRAMLRASPGIETVVLESPGGRLIEARLMADAIKKRRLSTLAVRHCESACTMVLLAGIKRYALLDARVGFHQATMRGNSAVEDQIASITMKDSFLLAGVSIDFVERAFSTSSQKMWYPSQAFILSSQFLTDLPLNWKLRGIVSELAKRLPICLDKFTLMRDVR